MSNSTSLIDQIASNAANKEVIANGNFDASSPAMLWGRRAQASAGLAWAYYGGWFAGAQVANGSLSLTPSTTNYVQATSAGTVIANTTGFIAGNFPLYTVITGASAVTSWTDNRILYVASGQPVNLISYYPDTLVASARMLSAITPQPTTFLSGLPGSYAYCKNAPTATTTLTINRVTSAGVSTPIGSVAFAAGSKVGTFTFAAQVVTVAGDRIQVLGPDTPDTTISDIELAIVGAR
jgi:hypothetical protein